MSIHDRAIVDAAARLHPSVQVGPYAIIGAGVVLHAGVTVGPHAVLTGPMEVGAGTRIGAHACLGGDPQDLKHRGEDTILLIGEGNDFREFTTASRGTLGGGGRTRIGDHNLFMAYSHVAHDCVVGSGCVFSNAVNIAGHVEIQDGAVLGGLAAVHQHCRVGRHAMVGGGAMVAQDVPPFVTAQGDRARLFGLNIVGLRRAGFDPAVVGALKAAYRDLFHQGLPLRIALEQVRAVAGPPEVQELCAFVEGSARGICRSAGADAAPE